MPGAPPASSPNSTDLRSRVAEIQGSIVATTDGLVIAHDLGDAETYGVQPEGVAALSAVNLGLSQRITDTASHGELIADSDSGCLRPGAHLRRRRSGAADCAGARQRRTAAPHTDTRSVADRVAELLADAWQDAAATWHA